jgi:serine/threonine protein kinase
MELVRGIRITQYCDQSRLDVAERLALFSQVCQAIHHAHEKGVIHRDIKPSNVLVTLREGAPVVKVIDFGIAKAMQGRLTELTLSTVLGQFLGTPAYVSPEQTVLAGTEVDARSDVYSLGVLLYELLTGCTPIDAGELSQASLDEIRRRIREEEPLSPSRRVGAIIAGAKSGTQPLRAAAFLQQMKGDLDWIVMRTLSDRQRSRARRAALSAA